MNKCERFFCAYGGDCYEWRRSLIHGFGVNTRICRDEVLTLLGKYVYLRIIVYLN